MSVLYLALAIYIIGVALVLYIRPSVMFHPDNGTWKEFGLDSGRNSTVFPLWMFTIVWAFLSYAIASIGNVFVANIVLNSAAGTPESHIATPISELRYTEAAPPSQVVHTENTLVPAPRVRAPRMPKVAPPPPVYAPVSAPVSASVAPTGTATQLPGYYIVEPQPSGVPKFIYFGHEPPTFENLSTK